MAFAVAEQGYEDERFSQSVSAHFHCGICLNVFKEPVTCARNEHYFCRACITEHLKNSPRCPTCQDKLSIETIVEAPRILRNCLDELNIRCDFSRRGCQETVQLAQLQAHVEACGYAPVLCPNEGCLAAVNRQDLAQHEEAFCEVRRKGKCCDCSELKEVVDEVNVSTKAINEQVKDFKILKDIKECLLAVKEEVSKTKEDMINRLETLEKQVKATKEMQEALREAQSLRSTNSTLLPQNILVAGGRRTDYAEMKSVELFNLSGMSWSPLLKMNESRVGASAFVFNDEITIVGGNTNHGPTGSITNIPISPIMKSASWSQVSFQLPRELYGHVSVPRSNGIITNIGGCHRNKNCSKEIVQASRRGGQPLLPSLPQPRCFFGSEVFSDKIFLFGGRSSVERNDVLNSVISYDFVTSRIEQLAPLPYAVSEIATVKWGDNVVLVGGADQQGKPLATVVIYNVTTEKWHYLPPMNKKRRACSAVVFQKMIVVLGGRDENNACLRSVECFTFDSYAWKFFPVMITARERAVAVVF